jgi:hypothetical protein
VIGSSQRPLPDNTQHLQETDIHAPAGFEPTIPASERPQTYALDGAATGFGLVFHTNIYFCYLFPHDTRKQLTHSARQDLLENTIFVQMINKFPTVMEPEILLHSRKQNSCSTFHTRTPCSPLILLKYTQCSTFLSDPFPSYYASLRTYFSSP